MTSSDWHRQALALPPLPRLATPRGFALLRGGEGLQPLATLATCFKKVIEIEELRESFQF